MGPDRRRRRVPEANEAQPGSPGASFYDPICVAESERGRGLATALFVELRERLPGRECSALSGRIELLWRRTMLLANYSRSVMM